MNDLLLQGLHPRFLNPFSRIISSHWFEGISKKDEFYFVHSYFVKTNNKNDDLFRSKYGNEFVSGFAKENIFGLQFHPEKSYDAGIKILKNFCNL